MTAIEFDKVSKQYRLGKIGTGTLSHDLNRWWYKIRGLEDPYLKVGQENLRTEKSGFNDYIWALRDITFSVERGDVVGIIGNNGAGKSTLLKILSRVTAPTTGEIRSRGRVGSLLEVGTGFHPEMSGRENIFMNGSIMGMTRNEIKRKFDDIVDFSGVAKYIDTPTKRYSSGMSVRLGFAIAAFLEPEILVVDEVLAVGDAEFQKKAIGKIQDVSKDSGRTVLFVSHNMDSIVNLCDYGVLLNKGSVEMIGPVDKVVDQYISSASSIPDIQKARIDNSYRRKAGTMNVEFVEIERLSARTLAINEPIVIGFRFKKNDNFRPKARIVGMLNYGNGSRVGLFFSEYINLAEKGNYFDIILQVNGTNLTIGSYYFDFSLSEGDITSGLSNLDLVYRTINFEVKYYDKNHEKLISLWDPKWGRSCYLDVEIL